LNASLAYGIVSFAALWRWWAQMRWTFQGEDWRYIHDASQIPFFRFVTMLYKGHLLPGRSTIVWLVTRIAPLNYALAMAPLLIATVLGGVLMWKLLQALFGDSPANLIPLALFVLCPLSLPPVLLWTSALTLVPLEGLIVAILLATVLYVRSPSRKRLAAVGLAYAGALLFWEKALLIPPLVAMFGVLFLGEGHGRPRLRNVLVGRRMLWVLLVGLTIPYGVWYFAVAQGGFSSIPTIGALWRTFSTAVGSSIIPSALGGPWAPGGKATLHELSTAPRIMTWILAAAIVGVSVARDRQAWRAWVLPLVYTVLSVVLVASARVGTFSPEVLGLAPRYFADVVPVLALAIALAFMVPLERQGDVVWPRERLFLELTPDSGGDSARRLGLRGLLSGRTETGARMLGIGLILLYSFSALITSYQVAGLADRYSAKSWLANVKVALASHPGASIYDAYLPPRAAGLAPAAYQLSEALDPIAPRVRWDRPDEHIWLFDKAGRLRPASVVPMSSAARGARTGCSRLVYLTTVTATLQRPLPARVWWVWLTYYTDRSGGGFVSVDSDRQPVTFVRGLHGLTLIHRGPATSVTIDSGGRHVCVDQIRVGRPSAA